MSDVAVRIPFAQVDPGQSPNLRRPAGRDAISSYFPAMYSTFASLKRFEPELGLELITDSPIPTKYEDALKKLSVSVAVVAFEHQPPDEFMPKFAGSLYLLDALRLPHHYDQLMYLDPDVLCTGSLSSVFENTRDRIGAYRFPLDDHTRMNGISITEANLLHEIIDSDLAPMTDVPGGEILVVTPEFERPLVERLELGWLESCKRFSAGRRHMSTEEHLLGFALKSFDYRNLDEHIRRIWTAARYRTIIGDESKLALWHLPAEKSTGFRRIFAAAIEPDSWFWTATDLEFRDRAARLLGVKNRTFARILRDVTGNLSKPRRDRAEQ